MAFRFRLETNLKVAKQKLDLAQTELAGQIRILQDLNESYNRQLEIYSSALESKKEACIKEPANLSRWQIYCLDQKEQLDNYQRMMLDQEEEVAKYREHLKVQKIEFEKYKRLKEKKWKQFWMEELRKEQSIIDEIAQHPAELVLEI